VDASSVDDANADVASSSDSSASDASSDVAVLDAADASDGSIAPRFCTSLSPAPAFCSDFDDPTNAAEGWTASSAAGGASLTFPGATFVSAPRSLEAKTTQGNWAYLQVQLGVTTKISLEFDVRFAVIPAAGQAISPFMLTPPIYPGFDIYWFVDASNAYFQEYGDDFSQGRPSPTANAWHKVTLALTTNGTTSQIDASVDGTAYWTNHTLAHPWPAGIFATLRVGAARTYAQTNDVFVDNVIVKTE
jgi:hypothetical protein